MTPTVPPQFSAVAIAHVERARELAVAPNGDLFVGTQGQAIYVIPHADGAPQAPRVFVRLSDAPAAGITFGDGYLYVGAQFGVYRIPYRTGDLTAREKPQKIASVRTSGGSRDHDTTSVAFAGGHLYASVGSSCNNCDPELDPTRATVQEMNPDGSGMHARAVHIRNAIALATNENTGTVWAGDAGQDELPEGHPYEIFDPVLLHQGTPDYGWPYCNEDRVPVRPGINCTDQTVARVVFPAYVTPIGAAFYPAHPHGAHVFPQRYWGGAFVTVHGSWHQPLSPPEVVFVPMKGDDPVRSVNWRNPDAQWSTFAGGFQNAGGDRSARPTGIAVGPQGDLFVADDQSGSIFRVRAKS
jgi:glucose/arabinose dehydrogenase